MKSIDTLVTDIYALFTDDKLTLSEANVRSFGEHLANHIRTRISDERGAPTLRLSSLGTPCDRKLYYSINSPSDAEKLRPETRIKFLYGDILEELLLFLAAEAGHTVTGQQDTVDVHGVKGHRDAVIDGRVVDVKSASSRSFTKFANGTLRDDDPFGYITQLDSYRYGSTNDPLVTEKDVASFLVIDKTLGHICLDTHADQGVEYSSVVEAKKEMLAAPEPPPRAFAPKPYGKSGNMQLDTACNYCAFKHKCWPEVRTFLYSTGPVYLTEVTREPNASILEIDKNGNVVARD